METTNQETFRLYGEFLITFEHVCNFLRLGIRYAIFPQFNDAQVQQIEILTEGLTADSLRLKYLALLLEVHSADSEVLKLAKIISEVFNKVTPVRNSFAHGTSYIGKNEFIDEAKDGLLLLRHPKIKADGLDLTFKKFEIETLELGIKMLKALYKAISKLIILNEKKTLDAYEISLLNSVGLELKQMNKFFHERYKK